MKWLRRTMLDFRWKYSWILILVLGTCVSAVFSAEWSSRQKRCIVVQKQSGTHGDSTEGGDDDDDDERSTGPRDSKPDRGRVVEPYANKRRDVEGIPANPLKYQLTPTRHGGEWRRYRKRYYRI